MRQFRFELCNARFQDVKVTRCVRTDSFLWDDKGGGLWSGEPLDIQGKHRLEPRPNSILLSDMPVFLASLHYCYFLLKLFNIRQR